MKLLFIIIVLVTCGITQAAPPAQMQTVRTYDYMHAGKQALLQNVTCDFPTQRTDGTPLARADIKEIKWYLYYMTGSWPFELSYTTTVCNKFIPITNRYDFDLTATAVDRSTPPLESQRSPAIQFRFVQVP